MKKLLLGVLALGFLATSCKKDDDNNSPSAMLVGTWKVSKTVVISGKDGSILSSDIVTGCSAQDNTEFRSDKTFINMSYDNSGANGACALDYTETGSYSYNESTKDLSMTWAGNTSADVYKVENLTNNQMQVYFMDDDNNDGFPDKFINYMYK